MSTLAAVVSVAAVGAVATAVIALLLRWVTWSVTTATRQAVEQTVNGKIDGLAHQVDLIGDTVDSVQEWTVSHDRRHHHEQRQLIAALDRQQIRPPDGWPAKGGS